MPVPLLTLVQTFDAEGRPEWVEVTHDVARVLAETEPPLRERLLRQPANLDAIGEDRRKSLYLKGGQWEGPRFSFSLLLGESPTWSGPDSLWLWEGSRRECRFCCHVRRMPDYACCLGCDRTGRDRLIPRGREKPRHNRPKDKLRGGRG